MADKTKKRPAKAGPTPPGTPAPAGASSGGQGGGKVGSSLLNSIIQNGRLARDPSQLDNAKKMIAEFVNQVAAAPKGSVGDDIYSFIVSRISQIDNSISLQMDQIVHHPD